MALLNKKHWTLKTYTVATWTDLVAEPGIVAALVVCNTGAAAVAVQVRLTDGAGVETAMLVPLTTVEGNTSRAVDLRSVALQAGTKLQVYAAAAGIHFTASGAADA